MIITNPLNNNAAEKVGVLTSGDPEIYPSAPEFVVNGGACIGVDVPGDTFLSGMPELYVAGRIGVGAFQPVIASGISFPGDAGNFMLYVYDGNCKVGGMIEAGSAVITSTLT